MENNHIVTRLQTYLYKGGFSFKNYPYKLRYIKKFNKRNVKEKPIFKKIKSNFFFKIQLASLLVDKDVTNFWSNLKFVCSRSLYDDLTNS